MIPIRYIQIATAQHYEITRADILGPSKRRVFAHPRMLAMFLARRYTGKSFPQIGDAFAGRDHTTVMSAVSSTIDRMDDELRHDADLIILRAKKLWHEAQGKLETVLSRRAENDFLTITRNTQEA